MSGVVTAAGAAVFAPVALFAYAYAIYPAILRLLASGLPMPQDRQDPAEWPFITITLPCHNEERRIRAAIEGILRADYPADRRQVIVISDASTDATDSIAREYESRGIELLRLGARRGKTAAENAGVAAARGSIVINIDASVGIAPGSIKALVRTFADPTVGVASSRDVSVGDVTLEGNQGESGYVGYEMKVRALETRMGSIVGASGSFFAMRRELHERDFPEELSRDFASVLMARERGFRGVSVEDAICYVPRTTSLEKEFQRKIRTMARGLETLWYKRHLMNPAQYGAFAWMLVSHKLSRWLVYLTLPFAAAGLLVLASAWPPAWLIVGAAALGAAIGTLAMLWPPGRRVPHLLAINGFALASNLAGMLAWARFFRGESSPVWEPTRRD
jgi:cellulose synthase/poly-beta-1,6-N-acetylglucosamine synthase-like glycosyltransferase